MRKTFSLVSGLAAVSLLATGCLGGGSTPEASEDAGEETAKETIQIMYAFSGDQSTAFQSDMDTWGEANGITFDWIQSNEFEVQISSKVQSGNAPDIAIFPQPGSANDAKSGASTRRQTMSGRQKVPTTPKTTSEPGRSPSSTQSLP